MNIVVLLLITVRDKPVLVVLFVGILVANTGVIDIPALTGCISEPSVSLIIGIYNFLNSVADIFVELPDDIGTTADLVVVLTPVVCLGP